MTRDDIIRMAHEANRYANNQTDAEGYEWHLIRDERFAALVAAAEREACAKLCEDEAEKWEGEDGPICAEARMCAVAIRTRGEK